MSEIRINEISENFSYVIGNNSYCCVAFPITSCWGPGFVDPDTLGQSRDDVLEDTVWQRFPATQAGLSEFVATYRGPATNYRLAKDFSYQMALTLLSAGYDVLTCRLCPGTYAQSEVFTDPITGGTLTLRAKYPGSFGNNLMCVMKKAVNRNYWNMITYVIDAAGVKNAVENFTFVFDPEDSTDAILHISEVESKYIEVITTGELKETSQFDELAGGVHLGPTTELQGTDRALDTTSDAMMDEAIDYAKARFALYTDDSPENIQYIISLNNLKNSNPDIARASTIRFMEWIYYNTIDVLGLLTDRLSYNPQRLILPGWDDQNITDLDGTLVSRMDYLSPLHIKMMEVSYYARCTVAYLDTPKCLSRSGVYNSSTETSVEGYVQKLSRYVPVDATSDVNGSLWSTHYGLFGPWGTYTYIGTGKLNPAPAGFLALMLERAMIKNQSLQYEWLQPSSRKNTLRIGKMDYTLPKSILDQWQPDADSEGGCFVNAICKIPDLGMSVWGDATCYEVPPATHQALHNLSTRKLVNAIKDVAFRVGLSITFRYNNSDAYSAFYAGMTPILDTMVNVGALESYYITMAADLDAAGNVKANSVLGQIYIVPFGTIEKITIDIIALPVGTDLSAYAE